MGGRREGRGGEREGRKGEGNAGEGEGNCSKVLGGIDAPVYVISVLRKCFLGCVYQILLNLSGEKLMVVV